MEKFIIQTQRLKTYMHLALQRDTTSWRFGFDLLRRQVTQHKQSFTREINDDQLKEEMTNSVKEMAAKVKDKQSRSATFDALVEVQKIIDKLDNKTISHGKSAAARKLVFRNLPKNLEPTIVKELANRAGQVEAFKVITLPECSTKFAIVTYKQKPDQRAIEGISGMELEGRALIVERIGIYSKPSDPNKQDELKYSHKTRPNPSERPAFLNKPDEWKYSHQTRPNPSERPAFLNKPDEWKHSHQTRPNQSERPAFLNKPDEWKYSHRTRPNPPPAYPNRGFSVGNKHDYAYLNQTAAMLRGLLVRSPSSEMSWFNAKSGRSLDRAWTEIQDYAYDPHSLMVFNLPLVSSEDLHKLFSHFGRVVRSTVAQRSPGVYFGFVIMKSYWEAKNASLGLNGYELYGRVINVSEPAPEPA